MMFEYIDPTCVLDAKEAYLRTNYIEKLIWKYVTTTLIDEYNSHNFSETKYIHRYSSHHDQNLLENNYNS